MEILLKLHRVVYSCAGALLVLKSMPVVYPSKRSYCNEDPPEELVHRVRDIAKSMRLPRYKNIEVLLSDDRSNLSGGCTVLPNGAIVIISRSMLIQNEEEAKSLAQLVVRTPIRWNSPCYQDKLHLLVPTSDVINFRIAHEIAHLKYFDVWWKVLLPPVFLVGGYHMTTFLCTKYFMNVVKYAFPGLLAGAFVAYAVCKNLLGKWLELRADRKAALVSKSNAEGGVEFFANQMELEELCERVFPTSWVHRLIFGFRTHPPFEMTRFYGDVCTERLKRLEKILQKYS